MMKPVILAVLGFFGLVFSFGPGAANCFALSVMIAGKQVAQEAPQNLLAEILEIVPDASFPAPDDPSGMDIVNDEILMVSEQAGSLYVVDATDGSLIRTINLPGFVDWDPGSYGIASAGSFWWHSDYQRGKLYKLNPANGVVLAEFPMPSTYLGIAWDGSTLWGVSPNNAVLYSINPDSGSITGSWSLGSIAGPIDVTPSGSGLIVCERDGYKIHWINKTGVIQKSETVSESADLRGIANAGASIWVGTEDSMLHRFDLGSVEPCDADGDGEIDKQDALAVLAFLRTGQPLPGDGDCNQDGKINFRDVIAIIRASE